MSTRRRRAAWRRPRRTPVTWVRGGGLTTLLFLLPILLVFGAFSWYPIARTVIMSMQDTNLVEPATWVGLDNFRTVLERPAAADGGQEHARTSPASPSIFGYPDPARRRRADERGAALPRRVQRARVPPGRDPAGRRGAALEDVLRRQRDRRLQHDPGLGRASGRTRGCSRRDTAMPSLVLEATWANAGATVIIYLAALTSVNSELYEAASVDGASLWRKVWHITLPQLRGVLLVTMILQIIGTAQVFLEPYLFTSGGPTNSTLTVLLLIYDYAFGNSLGGDYGSATALSLMLAAFLALFSLVYLRLTRSWSTDMSRRRPSQIAHRAPASGV